MTTITKITLSALILAVSIDTYGALYTIINKGNEPITVWMDVVSTRAPVMFAPRDIKKTVFGGTVKPGATTQLNAGGGNRAGFVSIANPEGGKLIEKYRIHPYVKNKDKTFEFTQKEDNWFMNIL